MIINGKEKYVDKPMTVWALLNSYMLSSKVVVIHVNGVFIPTDQYRQTLLTNDDSVQMTTMVAGG